MAILCFWGICIIGVFVAGIVLSEYWLGYLAVIMLLLGHCWRNNTMMAYIEKNAYDGSARNHTEGLF